MQCVQSSVVHGMRQSMCQGMRQGMRQGMPRFASSTKNEGSWTSMKRVMGFQEQGSWEKFVEVWFSRRKMQIYAFVSGNIVMQYQFGTDVNFFHGKFMTKKDPDDLAEFYQAEDLLKIIAIHPIMFNFFMNKVQTCDEPAEGEELLVEGETQFKVRMLGMDVAFEIIQEEEEDEDGQSRLKYFNRHERFIDYFPLLPDLGLSIELESGGVTWATASTKFMLWDQVWNFGFKAAKNGEVEVFHHGEYFYGPWPIRFIVYLHQYYVIWACERVINGENFGAEDTDKVHEEMANVPLHVFKDFLANLRNQKQKSLDELTNADNQDAAAIDKMRETIKKIDTLSMRNKPTFSIAMRKGATGPVAKSMAVKVIAQDSETQELLASATAKDKQVLNAAIRDVIRNPATEFKRSTSMMRRAVSTVVRKPNIVAVPNASGLQDEATSAAVNSKLAVPQDSVAQELPASAMANNRTEFNSANQNVIQNPEIEFNTSVKMKKAVSTELGKPDIVAVQKASLSPDTIKAAFNSKTITPVVEKIVEAAADQAFEHEEQIESRAERAVDLFIMSQQTSDGASSNLEFENKAAKVTTSDGRVLIDISPMTSAEEIDIKVGEKVFTINATTPKLTQEPATLASDVRKTLQTKVSERNWLSDTVDLPASREMTEEQVVALRKQMATRVLECEIFERIIREAAALAQKTNSEPLLALPRSPESAKQSSDHRMNVAFKETREIARHHAQSLAEVLFAEVTKTSAASA